MGHLGRRTEVGGHRPALGCTAIVSYGAGWFPKVVVGVAHGEIQVGIWFEGWLEAPKCMTMGPSIHCEQILSVDQTDLNGSL